MAGVISGAFWHPLSFVLSFLEPFVRECSFLCLGFYTGREELLVGFNLEKLCSELTEWIADLRTLLDRSARGPESQRSIAVAITQAETALLWARKALSEQRLESGEASYAAEDRSQSPVGSE